MLQWPVTMASPQVVRNPVFVHATGVLLCVKDGDVNSSDDTVNLTLESVRGEPARMGVVSIQDPNIRALGKITPRPIESVDGGCRLSATYLTPRGEVVFVEASGLAAGEAFTMTLHSGSKDAKQQGKASPSGGYAASFLPVDPKASSGKGLAELRLRAPSCSPSLDFVWGDLTGQ
jgi:hypothetical protein